MKAALLTDQHIDGRLIPAGTIVELLAFVSGQYEVTVPVSLVFWVESDQLREVPSDV